MRGLIRIGVGLAVMGGLFVSTVAAWPIVQPERLGTLSGDVERGAYLARSSGCVACHTNTEAGGPALAGGAPLDTPFGGFVPPNITLDSEAGIGNWTLDQFAIAIRQGINPDGAAYYPAFPYEFYAHFTDQDIADLWAALAIVPTVSEPAKSHSVSFPFNQRWGLKLWRAAFSQPVELSPVIGRSETWNRGQELVQGAAHCAACHTARNFLGGLSNTPFTGNDTLPGGSVAPDITPETLLASGWNQSNLAYALRTGITPSGDVFGGSMAEVIKQGTAFLDETDRAAIAAYLTNEADPAVQPPSDGVSDSGGMVHTPGMVMQ
ncbi:MAG: cytochrome C [Paracoccaceae bacterium]|nr:cytochrome C [Paracoccaceae bacterium]